MRSLKQTSLAPVAASFCDLQQARHQADYDHLMRFSEAVTVAHIAAARRSIARLADASADERDAFYSLLALRSKIP